MMNPGPSLNSDRAHTGYSVEDKYFHDLELRRMKADESAVILHCPHCGADHHETKIGGVDATECSECKGVFFNAEHVMELKDLLAAGNTSNQLFF